MSHDATWTLTPEETAPPAVRAARRSRWPLVPAVLGLGLFAASYFTPWWDFALVAPQYPTGLHLAISLTGVTGDVPEIDIINHYIGMRSMSDAAALERSLAAPLVGGLFALAGALVAFGGRRAAAAAAAVLAILPLGFVLDTTYWMWQFGHDLDPTAPIDFPPFMPTLLGRGDIGQFHTVAWPTWGFCLAVGAVSLLALSAWMRQGES